MTRFVTSLISDRLHISLYKDAQECFKNGVAKTTLPLEEFYGIESGFALDREPHVMAIVCGGADRVLLLAFHNRETLIQWEIRIRSHLGEGECVWCVCECVCVGEHVGGSGVCVFCLGVGILVSERA